MVDLPGRFVWYELMAADTESAKAFYTRVAGWGTQDGSVPGMPYTIFTDGQMPVGGLMNQPEDARKMGAPPSWIGYVAVDDVDATAERIKSLGGSVHVPPTDIPNIGRFSVVADPQKAIFALFRSPDTCAQPLPTPGAPGHIGWHELSTTDWEKAFAFYSELFGWQKADAIDMGAIGTYQLFSVGGQAVGGMYNKPPMVPAPHWLYYVNVTDIDAAIDRVKTSGGQILNGPMQVPGGSWIVQGRDPQGAMFALVGQRA
jgi:predicted enzyme related to lactoylglutathione lyase